jgi:Peptidase family M28
MLLAPLLLAAAATAIDGDLALRHASQLAALGPHPWGSPRNTFAAEYVAAQFRAVGLGEVRLQPFEAGGIRGANVIGVLRASGPDFVVVGAHHDTAPGAPGAYDDGGGVGVVIEVARVLAGSGSRARTVVVASFDGEEAWATGKGTTVGSRAYVASLGTEARHLAAAFIVEMSGYPQGRPSLQTIAYADPKRPGGAVVAPGWLVRASLDGSRGSGSPFVVGDPLIPWLYQAGVRACRADFYGDDLSFLQAGLPAVFASDSSFSSFYPWYHQPGDSADRLSAEALARMGAAVLGSVQRLLAEPRGPESDPTWFAAFGRVIGPLPIMALAVLSVLPGLIAARKAGGPALPARMIHAALFGFLVFARPIPALWVFLFPNLLPRIRWPGARRPWAVFLAFLPALALLTLGVVAWLRGFVHGVFVSVPEGVAALLALLLLFVGRSGPPAPRFKKTKRPLRRPPQPL